MTIADDIIQHVNNFVERQKKQHRRLQGLMKEVDSSNSAIGLVQELAVMMNEINTASELYGRAFKPALDALWAEILETKKEAVEIAQREAEEPPIMYVGPHWNPGFPKITEGDIQIVQWFLVLRALPNYSQNQKEACVAMAIRSDALRDVRSDFVYTSKDILAHLRIPRPTKEEEK